MGKMGKNFLKTNLTVDNLKQLGSKDNSPLPYLPKKCCPDN